MAYQKGATISIDDVAITEVPTNSISSANYSVVVMSKGDGDHPNDHESERSNQIHNPHPLQSPAQSVYIQPTDDESTDSDGSEPTSPSRNSEWESVEINVNGVVKRLSIPKCNSSTSTWPSLKPTIPTSTPEEVRNRITLTQDTQMVTVLKEMSLTSVANSQNNSATVMYTPKKISLPSPVTIGHKTTLPMLPNALICPQNTTNNTTHLAYSSLTTCAVSSATVRQQFGTSLQSNPIRICRPVTVSATSATQNMLRCNLRMKPTVTLASPTLPSTASYTVVRSGQTCILKVNRTALPACKQNDIGCTVTVADPTLNSSSNIGSNKNMNLPGQTVADDFRLTEAQKCKNVCLPKLPVPGTNVIAAEDDVTVKDSTQKMQTSLTTIKSFVVRKRKGEFIGIGQDTSKKSNSNDDEHLTSLIHVEFPVISPAIKRCFIDLSKTNVAMEKGKLSLDVAAKSSPLPRSVTVETRNTSGQTSVKCSQQPTGKHGTLTLDSRQIYDVRQLKARSNTAVSLSTKESSQKTPVYLEEQVQQTTGRFIISSENDAVVGKHPKEDIVGQQSNAGQKQSGNISNIRQAANAVDKEKPLMKYEQVQTTSSFPSKCSGPFSCETMSLSDVIRSVTTSNSNNKSVLLYMGKKLLGQYNPSNDRLIAAADRRSSSNEDLTAYTSSSIFHRNNGLPVVDGVDPMCNAPTNTLTNPSQMCRRDDPRCNIPTNALANIPQIRRPLPRIPAEAYTKGTNVRYLNGAGRHLPYVGEATNNVSKSTRVDCVPALAVSSISQSVAIRDNLAYAKTIPRLVTHVASIAVTTNTSVYSVVRYPNSHPVTSIRTNDESVLLKMQGENKVQYCQLTTDLKAVTSNHTPCTSVGVSEPSRYEVMFSGSSSIRPAGYKAVFTGKPNLRDGGAFPLQPGSADLAGRLNYEPRKLVSPIIDVKPVPRPIKDTKTGNYSNSCRLSLNKLEIPTKAPLVSTTTGKLYTLRHNVAGFHNKIIPTANTTACTTISTVYNSAPSSSSKRIHLDPNFSASCVIDTATSSAGCIAHDGPPPPTNRPVVTRNQALLPQAKYVCRKRKSGAAQLEEDKKRPCFNGSAIIRISATSCEDSQKRVVVVTKGANGKDDHTVNSNAFVEAYTSPRFFYRGKDRDCDIQMPEFVSDDSCPDNMKPESQRNIDDTEDIV